MEVGETPTAIDTNKVNQLWVWVSGNLYVEYTGVTETTSTGWVAKELVSFDEESWQPTFGDNDVEYKLPEGREIYINMNGASYVARKEGGELSVQLELQTAANPENATTVVPDGTVLSEPWDENGATYEFVTDPASDDYLMLVYASVPDNAQDMDGNEVQVGDVVTTGKWGLRASIAGEEVDFNWEYNEWGWGSVTYLMDGSDYLILDDPVRFEPFEVELADSTVKTLALQFDGWMCGLPDLYRDLERNDWVMTTDISEKIINLPAGTALTDVATGIEYVLKPLEVSQFLLPAEAGTDTGLDDLLGDAEDVDISDVPDFTDNNMGDTPTGTELLYSEGKPVE